MYQPGSFEPFLLSPLDHTLPPVCPTLFLCFRLSEHQHYVSRLRRGIDIMLLRLPFLYGEVVSCVDEKGRAGRMKVQFPSSSIEGISMLSIRHYPDKTLPSDQSRKDEHLHVQHEVANLDQSYCPLAFITSPGEPGPVVRFQANILADGVLLSMSFNHQVADATGPAIILEMLAQGCRDSSAEDAQILPSSCQSESRLREQLSCIAHSLHSHQDWAYGPLARNDTADDASTASESETVLSDPDLKGLPFVFPPEKVVHLRDICNSLLPILQHEYQGSRNKSVHPSTHWPTFLSSNDVLISMILFCIERVCFENGREWSDSAGLCMAINLRSHLQPPLPNHYIGNVITVRRFPYSLQRDGLSLDQHMDTNLLAELPALVGEYELFHIANIAFQVRAMINSTDDRYTRGYISYLNNQSGSYSAMSGLSGLLVTSWRHLPVYDLDFGPGIGKIDHFESPPGMMEGACIILPANKNVGGHGEPASWDVRLMLKPEDMEGLVRDGLFQWALGG
ncbi:hypothetical protein P170DRAFT_460114 [Aspergillus steynii IBT 23096]|uniref:Trichothecene 3-O-acetyltransferase-like N-terminal domain-containing protein n=1 Tax=Aspergillus steynii IBT 23096 TaxID=1392250 RepID=A0A2I2GLL0_9EURO|nr:uncharacterized protein P170DRAFT_460114 [Aspergillus steynii IBT 23096]PLB53753.1 hypothetical protein P170DRAFT_460114 [Aspergillus steynii IBT 23096]